MTEVTMRGLWRPIAELTDRYQNNLLIRAPELVNLDCNEHGVAPGYWQDGLHEPEMTLAQRRGEEPITWDRNMDWGGWLGAGYDMSNDEWRAVPCTPTHFCVIEAPPWDLEAQVHGAMDAACANGCEGTMESAPAEEVVADLQECDAFLEKYPAMDIAPHVLSWRARRPLPPADAPSLVP